MTAADNNTSPVWEKILKSFREDLAANSLLQSILETKSMEELRNDTKLLQPLGFQGKKAVGFMDRLQPTLTLVDEFSTLVINCFDKEDALPGLIWGSIRMILGLASMTKDTLYEVSDMIHELGVALPPLKFYKSMPSFDPIDPEIGDSLVEIHTELVCFYARVIHFFKRNKHLTLVSQAWSGLRRDSHMTVKRVQKFSGSIMRDVQFISIRIENQRYNETLSRMTALYIHHQETQETVHQKRCHYIPCSEIPRFWNRQEVLSTIDDALSTNSAQKSLRSFAIYGMGGVGKTQIALRYANTRWDKYDTILWISAENHDTVAESFREAAKALDINKEPVADNNSVILDVKMWLSTNSRWLLIIDNADDMSMLQHTWPQRSSPGGRILVTSRDSVGAIGLVSSDSCVRPFDAKAGSEALLKIVGLDLGSDQNKRHASAISSAFGGLPLALGQMGAFIARSRIPLKDFLPLYYRNATAIDVKNTINVYYSLTLANVWDTSLRKLPENAQMLLRVLAFLNPDNIQKSLLTSEVKIPILQFMKDELNLLDAEQSLLEKSLIDKSRENGAIRVHKLVQRAVIHRMSHKERQEVFSILVDILMADTPNRYTVDLGHQVSTWAQCERALPHIETMLERNSEYSLFTPTSQKPADLALHCGWYFYEKGNYSFAKHNSQIALQFYPGHRSLAYASALDLRGLIELDISYPMAALEAFQEAHKIRTSILLPEDVLLAASLVNIGLAFTELGRLDEAQSFLSKSIDLRLQHDSNQIGNSYNNMASLLLRKGQANKAEEMLKCCPSLKDFTDDTFVKTDNPQFSGEIFLLSRIRLTQGRYDESLKLASKALSFRRKCLGNHLKVCDSLYHLAGLHDKGGNQPLSVERLKECIEISNGLKGTERLRHLARANYKLSQLKKSLEESSESTEYLDRALALRSEICKLDESSLDKVPEFENLVPWMLL